MVTSERPRPDAVRVSFLISGLERGGTELRLLEMTRRFGGDVAVHVCATSERAPLRGEFEAAGASVDVVPVARPWRDWGAVRELVRHVARAGPGVVNSFDLKGLLLASLVRLLHPGRRVRVVHHVVQLGLGATRAQSFAVWRLLQRADLVVCDAQAIRDEVIGDRRTRPPVVVIPNGVDADHFAPDPVRRAAARAALGYAADDFVLGSVANLRPEKGHRLLVAAFGELAARHPRLRLLCVGGGPLLAEITAAVEAAGLAGRVRLTGAVGDVRHHLAAMDAFALCSSRDAFSNAVLQAMAMRLPVVCSRTGEHAMMLADGRAGLLFEPEDRAGLVAAVERVVTDPACRARLADGGRRLVDARYTVPHMVEQYARLFRGEPLLADRPDAGGAPA